MVPTTALAIPTYLLFSKVGLVNTPWAIILPSLVSPFGLYLMRVYAQDAVPDSLIEAGRIDGAGEFRIFFQVALRLLAPGFVTVLLFTLVATWNNYFLPLIMLNDPALYPVTVGLCRTGPRRRAAAAASTGELLAAGRHRLAVVDHPAVAAFLLLQRYWQSGLPPGRQGVTHVDRGDMTVLPPRVLFGAAYYHEYQPHERLKTDLDLMADAHFTVIRVGESVWSTWEPENGRFDLDWLQPVLDGAHERGIAVVLGTPTYAVPPWLARRYPEIAGERATGQRIPGAPGRRSTSPTPRSGSTPSGSIRQIVARYAGHPAVIGFQVDNEPGQRAAAQPRRLPAVRRPPAAPLRRRRDPQPRVGPGLLVAPAVHLGRPVDAGRQRPTAVRTSPGAGSRPTQTTEFIGWQADIVREYARPDQFVTTCLSYERPAVDDDDADRAARRHRGQPVLRHAGRPGPARPRPTRRSTWTTDGHLGAVPQRRPDVLLPPGAVPGHRDQRPVHRLPVGQPAGVRRPVAAGRLGADLPRRPMIEYWHWHTLHFGAETYWGGVLPHSGRPGRTYREIARLGAELDAAGDARRRSHPGRRYRHALLACRASG